MRDRAAKTSPLSFPGPLSSELEVEELPVKARIERCAMELFGSKGFANTSVREIVEAAGVTKPSLYYYFHNKDDLYEKLIHDSLGGFLEEMAQRAGAPGSLADRLQQIVEVYFESLGSSSRTMVRFMFRALLGLAPHSPQVDFLHYVERNRAVIRQVLKQAVETGELPAQRASELAVTQFSGLIHIYVMRCALGYQDDLTPALAGEVVELFLKGLESPL